MFALQQNEKISAAHDDAVETGFAEFVCLERTSLVRYAALLTGSIPEAEDLVHEVLVRLMDRWDGLDEPLPYVRRSITNEFLSWRRRWSTRNIALADLDDLDRSVIDRYEEARPDPQMWALLMSLSRSQRCALVLRYYEGFDDPEIAHILDCRPATVRSHIHRGIAAIRKALAEGKDNEKGIGENDD